MVAVEAETAFTLIPASARRAVIAARKPIASSEEWTVRVIMRETNA
jgi:hypothetical protein